MCNLTYNSVWQEATACSAYKRIIATWFLWNQVLLAYTQLPQGCHVVEGKGLSVRWVEYTCFVIVTHIVIFVSASNKELHYPLQPCSMGNSGSTVQASFDILNGTYPQWCVMGWEMPSIAYHLHSTWKKYISVNLRLQILYSNTYISPIFAHDMLLMHWTDDHQQL